MRGRAWLTAIADLLDTRLRDTRRVSIIRWFRLRDWPEIERLRRPCSAGVGDCATPIVVAECLDRLGVFSNSDPRSRVQNRIHVNFIIALAILVHIDSIHRYDLARSDRKPHHE
jgi:hypothetical protein